ncbi:methyltransferase [Macrolepiota fuliginosa MF-IS2]|uniref:tRNA N(3)-methylcytidine methyltransferase n=1 Tax=Macrolepiota fuliginosa MF-IS2 TaxID=1400762 RepID=A0A9P5XMT4_9AGAR|nr:methyltransferase [Macrolepiota fuliginosa MF-IS2]
MIEKLENILKTTSSVHDIATEKPPFGSRFLTDEADVWSQNAWDHVPPPDDQGEIIAASLNKQRSSPIPVEEHSKYNEKPARHWDNFYKANASNFFRNRKWLHNEFPELVAATQPEAGSKVIAEIGCGAGNSVFPLLSVNRNPELVFKAYDYSNHAVKLVQTNPLYVSPPCGLITASVWDVTSSNGLPADVTPQSVDVAILVFVMSALHPDEWARAVNNIHTMLKPGGLVVIRDYGRYDLTQLRFKANRMLDENFYIRGDKTRVYFFELDELALMFTGSKALASQITNTMSTSITEDDERTTPELNSLDPATEGAITQAVPVVNAIGGAIPDLLTQTEDISHMTSQASDSAWIHPNLLSPLPGYPSHPLFTTEQLGVDRRLLVNRKRQLRMYRVWMQGKFRKIVQ